MSETWCQLPDDVTIAAPSVWVARDFEEWPDAEARVRVLVAGPGFGKTQGARAIARGRARAGDTILWLGLRECDATPDGVLAALQTVLSSQWPEVDHHPLSGVRANMAEQPVAAWKSLWLHMGTFGVPLTLVLDDCHGVCRVLGDAFWRSLMGLPGAVRVVLTSRERFDGPLAWLQAQGCLRVITAAALRWSDAEIRQVVQQVAPGRLGDRTWWRAVAPLGGWPLGVMVLAAAPDAAPNRGKAGPHFPAALTGYIDDECLSVLDSSEKDALLALALLEECDTDAWQVLVPGQPGDWLHRLARLGLFDSDAKPALLHAHIRQQVLAAGLGLLSAATRISWHSVLADHYLANEEPRRALPHLAAARRYDALAGWCEACFPGMYTAGLDGPMLGWLQQLPAGFLRERPALAYWRARLSGRRDVGLAAEWERLRAWCQQSGDADTERAVLLVALREAVWEREAARWPLLGAALEPLMAGAPGCQVAEWLVACAERARREGDWEKACHLARRVCAMPDDGDPRLAFARVEAAFELTHYWLMRGDWAMAGEQVREACEQAQDRQFSKLVLLGRFVQASVMMHAGRMAEAAALVQRLPGDWSQALAWHQVAFAYAVLGWIETVCEGENAGDATLLRSLGIFVRHGDHDGAKGVLARLLHALLAKGQSAQAERVFEQWGLDPGEGYPDACLLQARALNLAQMGRLDEALGHILRLGGCLERLKASWALMMQHLIEALLRQRLGQGELAARLVKQAQALSEEMGYGNDLLALPGWFEPLMPVLTASGASGAAESRPDPGRVTLAGPAPDQGLTVRLFGAFEVWRDGEPISEWPRRKAQLVLAGLVLYPRGLLLVELAERLGRDDGGGSVTTTKVAVSALRRVLEPGIPEGAWRLIVREGERYKLDPTALAHCDVLAFENHLNQADRLWQTAPPKAAVHIDQALAVYRGHLLDQPAHERYFIEEREAFRQRAHAAFLRLARFHGERNHHREAERLLEQAAQLWPADEDVAGALMVHFHRQGLHDRLRMTYWDCRKALKSVLNRAPNEEFEALYRRLQTP